MNYKAFKHIRILEIDDILIDYEELDINFTYQFSANDKSNIAEFNVYNLKKSTRDKIKNAKEVRFTCGYEKFNGVLFQGEINQVSESDTNNGDIVITITCTPKSKDWNNKFISKSYNRGVKYETVIRDIIKTSGWTIGSIEIPLNNGSPYVFKGGKTYNKTAKECLTGIAEDLDLKLQFNNGIVSMYPKTKSLNRKVTLDANLSMQGIPRKQKDNKESSSTTSGKDLYKINSILRYDFEEGLKLEIINSKYINGEFKIVSGKHIGEDNSMRTELIAERIVYDTKETSNISE